MLLVVTYHVHRPTCIQGSKCDCRCNCKALRLVWLVCTDASQKPALSCQLRTWSMLRTRNNAKSHNPNGTRCLHHAKEWSREHLSLLDLDYKLIQPIDGVWKCQVQCSHPSVLSMVPPTIIWLVQINQILSRQNAKTSLARQQYTHRTVRAKSDLSSQQKWLPIVTPMFCMFNRPTHESSEGGTKVPNSYQH